MATNNLDTALFDKSVELNDKSKLLRLLKLCCSHIIGESLYYRSSMFVNFIERSIKPPKNAIATLNYAVISKDIIDGKESYSVSFPESNKYLKENGLEECSVFSNNNPFKKIKGDNIEQQINRRNQSHYQFFLCKQEDE